MPLGVWEVAWDLARCETAFQDSGEPDRVRAESQAGGRLCLWRSQGYLGLVSWTRGRVGWRHAFQLSGVAQAKAEDNRVRTSYQCPHVLHSFGHCAILLML